MAMCFLSDQVTGLGWSKTCPAEKSGNLVFIFFILASVKFLPEGQVTGLGSDGNVFS